MMKKVVVTEGKFKDYIDEMQQGYELGFTPYRLHKNADGTFVTPIGVHDVKVYVGLYLNESKTEYINKCTTNNDHTIKTLNNATLKQVDDYKYLGSYISSSLKDFQTRKGMA